MMKHGSREAAVDQAGCLLRCHFQRREAPSPLILPTRAVAIKHVRVKAAEKLMDAERHNKSIFLVGRRFIATVPLIPRIRGGLRTLLERQLPVQVDRNR